MKRNDRGEIVEIIIRGSPPGGYNGTQGGYEVSGAGTGNVDYASPGTNFRPSWARPETKTSVGNVELLSGLDEHGPKSYPTWNAIGVWGTLGLNAVNVIQAGRGLVGLAGATKGAAQSAAQGAKLAHQLASKEIAGGHSFLKHVVGRGEFPGVRTRAEFAEVIEGVMSNASQIRHLSNGRTAFWRNGVVVIRNPAAADGGTAFVPTNGINYFLGLK